MRELWGPTLSKINFIDKSPLQKNTLQKKNIPGLNFTQNKEKTNDSNNIKDNKHTNNYKNL